MADPASGDQHDQREHEHPQRQAAPRGAIEMLRLIPERARYPLRPERDEEEGEDLAGSDHRRDLLSPAALTCRHAPRSSSRPCCRPGPMITPFAPDSGTSISAMTECNFRTETDQPDEGRRASRGGPGARPKSPLALRNAHRAAHVAGTRVTLSRMQATRRGGRGAPSE